MSPASITDAARRGHRSVVARADDERAGAIEPYRDAVLYDWEYRRRRDDVAFYRMLAGERGGPVLDLGCGSGRVMLPLVRDGHRVCGIDLSPQMLTRASQRLQRVAARRRDNAMLVRGDLRALPVRGRFPLVIAAFHTVQHLVDDRELVAMFKAVRRLVGSDGWFAFDVFSPDPAWLSRPPDTWHDRTIFRHPASGKRLAYSVSHRLQAARRALHMRLGYQPVDATGRPAGRRRTIRLCHRQLSPDDVTRLLRRSGLHVLARWGGFAGEPLIWPPPTDRGGGHSEQHVYLAGPRVARSR
jgi:SAM-dependent methyltransferase